MSCGTSFPDIRYCDARELNADAIMLLYTASASFGVLFGYMTRREYPTGCSKESCSSENASARMSTPVFSLSNSAPPNEMDNAPTACHPFGTHTRVPVCTKLTIAIVSNVRRPCELGVSRVFA